MARFKYVARTPAGERVSSTDEAPDAKAMAAMLRAKGMIPLSVQEAAGGRLGAARASRRKGGKPKLTDVAVFARQLATLLNAGISLSDALEDLATQMEKPGFAEVLSDIRNKVMGGTSLSSALREHPKVFATLFCAMVRAGEESGNLESIMGDLAAYLEREISTRRQIKSALMYPALVGVVFSGVVAFLFLWLLPRFKSMFDSLGGELPLVSQVALSFSSFVQSWIFVILPAAVGAVFALRSWVKTPRGREAMDKLKLRAPLFGGLVQKFVLVRFLETLATLQRSGVPILMSLELASDTAGSVPYEQELDRARREVAQGSFLSAELAKSALFPRMMVRMLAVGEETGKVDDLLKRTAVFYQEDLDARIQGLTRLIEPLLIVMMGGVVAFVVLAVYLPIFKIASTVKG